MRIRLALLLAAFCPPAHPLDIPIDVHEAARAGSLAAEPVTLVFPLPDGAFDSASGFTLTDAGGKPVPAQFSALTRWQGGGRYIQHLLVNALADLPGGGSAGYRLKRGVPAAPAAPVTVVEDKALITVNTGVLRFTVRKRGFNLFEQAWIDGREIIAPDPRNGGVMRKRDGKVQLTSSHPRVRVAVEESGPVRAVLSVFGETEYRTRDDFRHGFRCRIYAYAGKPWVKVDFTLRNTPHHDSREPAGPMYFTDFSLEHLLKIGGEATAQVGSGNGAARAASVAAADSTRQGPGWIDASGGGLGVMAAVRYFRQQYPMELRFQPAEGRLKLGFWPAGFRDYYYPGKEGPRAPADLFWLDDGVQKTHQVCYLFHAEAVPAAALAQRAAVCETPPVGRVAPPAWAAARSLPDGGYIDPATSGRYAPRTQFAYGKHDFNGEVGRRSTGGAGGLPRSMLPFIATGDVRAWLDWEPFYLMETDARPSHMDDLMLSPADTAMDLFTNQYRKTHYKNPRPWDRHPEMAYLENTGTRYHAWDAEHMWIYPFYEAFLINGDSRIRDFYQELGGFMAFELTVQQLRWHWQWGGVPPNNARGAGHPMAALNLAYAATGKAVFHQAAKDWVDHAFRWMDRADGTWRHNENVPFMEGYFARALLNFTRNCSPRDEIQKQKAISLVSAFIDAGMKWSWVPGKGFGYQHWDTASAPPSGPSVASVTMADPVAWLYLTTGYARYRDSLLHFNRSFPDFLKGWEGSFIGRTTTYMEKVGLPDTSRPAAITDLRVTGASRLSFTSPGGKSFVIRWYTRPIRDTHFEPFDPDTSAAISWWAAHVSPSLEAPLPAGRPQTLDLYDVPRGVQAHVMVKVVGSNGNWSRGSNVAEARVDRTLPSGMRVAPPPPPPRPRDRDRRRR